MEAGYTVALLSLHHFFSGKLFYVIFQVCNLNTLNIGDDDDDDNNNNKPTTTTTTTNNNNNNVLY
jgi:hypothetical protein